MVFNEEAFVQSLKINDPKAQILFIKKIKVFILQEILKHYKDYFEVQSLLNEVCYKVFANVCKFDRSKGTFGSWVRTLVRNHVIDQVRKDCRLSEKVAEFENDFRILDALIEEEEDPLIEKVENGLSKLPQKDYEVLYMQYFDNLPTAEIADRVGIDPNTARARIHRAKKKLKVILESQILP
jgi:RNA polymerase sigma-70 factor (ECF subfamily)